MENIKQYARGEIDNPQEKGRDNRPAGFLAGVSSILINRGFTSSKTGGAMQEAGKKKNWFQLLKSWVRAVAHMFHPSDKPQLEVLFQLESADGKCLARLVRNLLPGAVDTWYITYTDYPNAVLIIALFNLRQLKPHLEEPLPDDEVNVTRTHMLSVQWLISVGERQKRVYKFKGAWIGDLQGTSGGINTKASDITKYIVLEILRMTPAEGFSWESRLDKYPWEDTITSKCRIISANHKPHLLHLKIPATITEETDHD